MTVKTVKYEIENITDFSLKDTLECGQCFRFYEDDKGGYTGVVGKSVIRAFFCEEEGTLVIEESGEEKGREFYEEYFDLKRDYGKIKKYLINKDKKMKEVIEYGKGIHILKQEPFETLISFIISQNNHIKRIKKSIKMLSEEFGEEIKDGSTERHYAFPEPKKLASLAVEDLSDIKLGYRDKYIIEAAKRVEAIGEEEFKKYRDKCFTETKSYLEGFLGIGEKVAGCVLLFGFNMMAGFPIDVWMKRIMRELYGVSIEDRKTMEEISIKLYGKYKGIAQQYLFNYAMKKKIM